MDGPIADNLVTAIITWIDEQDSYATKTKLLKLLYLFDVEYYRVHRRTFTGFSWKFFHLGPWAAEYDPVLQSLVAHGLLTEQRSTSELDTVFYKPGEPVEIRRAVANVGDESILRGVLKLWGKRTTGEILNHVYFQTPPMESAIRNQPLDFSTIPVERKPIYHRSESGKTPSEIQRLRAKFMAEQAKKHVPERQTFAFTPPKYDDEYLEAMRKLETA